MMTSTFPTSRSSSLTIRNGIKEMQGKKEVLLNLEATLKRKINEFRELCLKEGELTGQLPLDYPLQPREPIPQVRRRITRSSGNIHEGATKFLQPLTQLKCPVPVTSGTNNGNNNFAVPSIPHSNVIFPSRPTSTNSSSSSTSTASSNTRSINQQVFNNDLMHLGNRYFPAQQSQQHQHQQQQQPRQLAQHFLNSKTTIQADSIRPSSSNGDVRFSSNTNHHFTSNSSNAASNNGLINALNVPEKQPRRNMTTNNSANNVNNITATKAPPPAMNPKSIVNIDGLTNIQTSFYEETKPFQMSDFYKYSSKHRQKVSPMNGTSNVPATEDLLTSRFCNNNQPVKTTRQHQEEVSRTKNSLKFASYDDQIQASVKLIEKSGQKFMEATAKAIAGNPGLAERLRQYSK